MDVVDCAICHISIGNIRPDPVLCFCCLKSSSFVIYFGSWDNILLTETHFDMPDRLHAICTFSRALKRFHLRHFFVAPYCTQNVSNPICCHCLCFKSWSLHIQNCTVMTSAVRVFPYLGNVVTFFQVHVFWHEELTADMMICIPPIFWQF